MSTQDQVVGGLRELDDLLATLPAKTQKNIARTMLRAGAAPILNEVRRNIPSDSGQLAASARITSRAKNGQVSASVKVGNFVAWYAHLVEFGTRPHIIKAKNNGALSFGGRTVEQVNHPGTAARPFMRPAAEAAFAAAIVAARNKLRERLSKNGLNVPGNTPSDPEE